MKCILLTERPNDVVISAWNDLLDNSEWATHYTSVDFFSDPFVRGGSRFAALAINDNEQVDALLTGVHSKGEINSGFGVRPQLSFRKDVDRYEAIKAIFTGLDNSDLKPSYIRFYAVGEIDGIENSGFAKSGDDDTNAIVTLDLSKGAESLFNEFSSNRRNTIRKNIKLDLVTIKPITGENEIDELLEIHRAWCLNKGFSPDSYVDFRASILNTDHRLTLAAKVDGKLVAGSFFRFYRGGIIEYAANNSLPNYNNFNINEFICWRAIEWACENGFSKMSLGASHPFLRRFGGEIVTSNQYTLDRTFLKRHNLTEALANSSVKFYQNLPTPIRSMIKAASGK